MEHTARGAIRQIKEFVSKFEQLLTLIEDATAPIEARKVHEEAALGEAHLTIESPLGFLGVRMRLPPSDPTAVQTESIEVSLCFDTSLHHGDADYMESAMQLVNGWDQTWYLSITQDHPESEPFTKLCTAFELKPGDEPRELDWEQAKHTAIALAKFYVKETHDLPTEE